MWVRLNDAGMRVWGNVFPDGKVPVCSFTFQEAKLGSRVERVILVAWNLLSKEEKAGVLAKISEKSGHPKDEILKDILRIGLPLRESFTTHVVAEELRFLI
jgi:hypothetical protein